MIILTQNKEQIVNVDQLDIVIKNMSSGGFCLKAVSEDISSILLGEYPTRKTAVGILEEIFEVYSIDGKYIMPQKNPKEGKEGVIRFPGEA